MWIAIILIFIVLLILTKFIVGQSEIKERNKSLGGLKIMLPQWVEIARENKMEMIKDTGADIEFRARYKPKVAILNEQDKESNLQTFHPYSNIEYRELDNRSIELYLSIQSKYTNIARGWVIHNNGEVIKSGNVEFGNNISKENAKKIFLIIMEDLKNKSAFNYCRNGHEWEYHNVRNRHCIICNVTQTKYVTTTTDQWHQLG